MELNLEQATEYFSGLAGKPRAVTEGAKPFCPLPPSWGIHDLEKTMPKPSRKTGTMTLTNAQSFIDYAKRHKDEATTLLFADEAKSKFKVVFNHHSDKADAGWADHYAMYNCPLSTEWLEWTSNNKKEINQETFALFIENNNLDIVSPDPASMLEIARTLQAKKKVDFSSAIRLDNGQNQFSFTEEVTGTAGEKGQFNIPEMFTIGIPVYTGGQAYSAPVRFRYRISGGKLVIWYDMLRPHKVLEAAFTAILSHIKTETGMPVLMADL